MDLLKQREAVLAEHKRQQKTRGSGWHPADDGALRREQGNELELADRPVAFQDDDRIRVVGPCAARVREALELFLAGGGDVGLGDRWQAMVVAHARRVLEEQPGDLCVGTQAWNYLTSALAAAGVQVVLTSVAR